MKKLLLINLIALSIFAADSRNDDLIWACLNGNVEQTKQVLAAGANPNQANQYGLTPLHRASYKGHKEIAELLLKNGADISQADIDGETPLHKASFYGHKEIAEFLLKNGADPNQANNDGKTPLHKASLLGRIETIQLLLDYGADKFLLTHDGKTAQQFAHDRDHSEAAKLLENTPQVLRLHKMVLNVIAKEQVQAPAWLPPVLLDRANVYNDQVKTDTASSSAASSSSSSNNDNN